MLDVNVKGRVDISFLKVMFYFKILGKMMLFCVCILVDVLYLFEINVIEMFLLNVNVDYEEDVEVCIVEGEMVDL